MNYNFTMHAFIAYAMYDMNWKRITSLWCLPWEGVDYAHASSLEISYNINRYKYSLLELQMPGTKDFFQYMQCSFAE